MNVYTFRQARIALAAFTGLAACAACIGPAHSDETRYVYTGQSHCLIRGVVRRVDASTNHLTLIGDDSHVYIVDAYDAMIILPDITRNAQTSDLERGMHVRATGTLVGADLIEATTLRVVSDEAPPPVRAQKTFEDLPAGRAALLGVIRSVDPDQNHITVADADGQREVVDTLDATITLPDGRAFGQAADLIRGMTVEITGTRLTHARMVAEQVRVVPQADEPVLSEPVPVAAAPAPTVPLPVPAIALPPVAVSVPGLVPPSPDPQYVLANLDNYTGILIDTRHLPNILRSPAPNVFGPDPGDSLIYPDRSHVPTPDEVQDESIVRYYRTPAEARAGVCGDNPLILPGQAVLTPAQDSVQLSANDMVLFNALEQKLHFSRTWKVGFLVPGDK